MLPIARRHSYRGDFTADEVATEHLTKIAQADIRAATAEKQKEKLPIERRAWFNRAGG